MARYLKEQWQSKNGMLGSVANWMCLISRLLNRITIDGNPAVVTGNGIQLTSAAKAVAASFSGTYYFKGKLYELSGDSKAYWYHNAKTGSGSWSDGPAPDPMPDSHYWRKTSTCNAVEYIMC